MCVCVCVCACTRSLLASSTPTTSAKIATVSMCAGEKKRKSMCAGVREGVCVCVLCECVCAHALFWPSSILTASASANILLRLPKHLITSAKIPLDIYIYMTLLKNIMSCYFVISSHIVYKQNTFYSDYICKRSVTSAKILLEIYIYDTTIYFMSYYVVISSRIVYKQNTLCSDYTCKHSVKSAKIL